MGNFYFIIIIFRLLLSFFFLLLSLRWKSFKVVCVVFSLLPESESSEPPNLLLGLFHVVCNATNKGENRGEEEEEKTDFSPFYFQRIGTRKLHFRVRSNHPD